MISESRELNENDVKTEEITDVLLAEFNKVSLGICEASEIKKRRVHLTKLIHRERCAIGYIHEIDTFITNGMEIIDEILNCISSLRKSLNFIMKTELDLEIEYYCQLDMVIPHAENQTTHQIKQRFPEWVDRKEKVKITGSLIYPALGLDGLVPFGDVKVPGLQEKERSDKC
ncbi:hypothetical protein ACF0H5_015998 [Mactra antiquata]